MYIAKIAGHTITPGTELEIQGIEDNFKFKVLEVLKHSFRVLWLAGDSVGNEDSLPHSLFASIGQEVEVIEILDDDNNPNSAFLRKRLADG